MKEYVAVNSTKTIDRNHQADPQAIALQLFPKTVVIDKIEMLKYFIFNTICDRPYAGILTMNSMKVMDWQTKQLSEIPSTGEGNWASWIKENGYELIDREELGYTEIELYENSDNGVFAIYHPNYVGLETESLYINISTEEDARQLMGVAQQLVAGMGGITMYNMVDEEDEDEE